MMKRCFFAVLLSLKKVDQEERVYVCRGWRVADFVHSMQQLTVTRERGFFWGSFFLSLL